MRFLFCGDSNIFFRIFLVISLILLGSQLAWAENCSVNLSICEENLDACIVNKEDCLNDNSNLLNKMSSCDGLQSSLDTCLDSVSRVSSSCDTDKAGLHTTINKLLDDKNAVELKWMLCQDDAVIDKGKLEEYRNKIMSQQEKISDFELKQDEGCIGRVGKMADYYDKYLRLNDWERRCLKKLDDYDGLIDVQVFLRVCMEDKDVNVYALPSMSIYNSYGDFGRLGLLEVAGKPEFVEVGDVKIKREITPYTSVNIGFECYREFEERESSESRIKTDAWIEMFLFMFVAFVFVVLFIALGLYLWTTRRKN